MKVEQVLKHRYPFLLVDKILFHEHDKKIKGLKNITFNEPWVPDHFPGNALYPGVLMLESMTQVGGLIFHKDDGIDSKMGWFAGADKVKFLRSAIPGDTLIISGTTLDRIGSVARVRCSVEVSKVVIAKAEITYVFR